MAQSKYERENFFSKERRKVVLVDWKPKKNAEDEKRIRLDFAMPLNSEPVLGMPGEIGDAMRKLEDPASAQLETRLDPEALGLKAQTVCIFSTDTTKRPFHTLVGVELRDLVVERGTGSDVKGTPGVSLSFNVNTQGSKTLLDWCWEHWGKVCFIECEKTQGEIEDAEEEEEEDRQPELVGVGTGSGKRGRGKSAAAGEDE